MKRFSVPALIALFFILESVFVQVLPGEVFNSDRIFVPRFLLVGLFFLAVFASRNYAIILAFVFGLLFDVVYTEIIGIYLFMFPLMVYGVSSMMKVLQANLVIVTVVSMLGIAILELGVYEMNFLIHRTDMPFQTFLSMRLLPTIILNLSFTIIVAYPLKKLFEKFSELLQND